MKPNTQQPSSVRRASRVVAGIVCVVAATAVAVVILTIPKSDASFTDATDNSANQFHADVLDPPTALVATSDATITLDWTATADPYATGHRIYRATNPGGPYSQIAEVTPRTTVTYVDNPATGTYYYVARAFTTHWESVDSNEDPAQQFACPNDADLRACLRFDDDVSGTYLDDSGNSNTVTHTNGSLIAGVSDLAIDDVPSALYEIADSTSLDLTNAMTIETWVYLDSQPGSGRVGIIDNDGQYGVFLYASTGILCSNSLNSVTNVTVPTNAWFHLACVWDGSALTVYVDGLSEATTSSTGTMATTNTDPVSLLNSSPAFAEPMDGAMDNLRIWHSARTQPQICNDAGISGC